MNYVVEMYRYNYFGLMFFGGYGVRMYCKNVIRN